MDDQKCTMHKAGSLRESFSCPAFLLPSIITFMVCILFLRLCVRLFIYYLADLVSLFVESPHLFSAFAQLKSADVFPSWIVTIIFAVILCMCVIKCRKAFSLKRFGEAVMWSVIVLVVFILSFVSSIYFTKVNNIPFGTVLGILYTLFAGGGFDPLL